MTLPELLIAIAVCGIIFLVIGTFLVSQFSINATNQNVAAQRQAAMYALSAISRDLRMIGYNSGGADDITSAGATSITFNTDWDSDGTAELYSYAYSGNVIRKNGTTIFHQLNVQSLSFSYYDTSGVEITDLSTTSNRAAIREIHVRLEVQLPSSKVKLGTNPPLTLEGKIKPRNMGL